MLHPQVPAGSPPVPFGGILRASATRIYPGTRTRHIHSQCNHTPLAWLTRQLCAASAPGCPSTSWVDVQAGMSRPGLFACRGKCRFLISSAAKRSCQNTNPPHLGAGGLCNHHSNYHSPAGQQHKVG